jgi:hypothetical protein
MSEVAVEEVATLHQVDAKVAREEGAEIAERDRRSVDPSGVACVGTR